MKPFLTSLRDAVRWELITNSVLIGSLSGVILLWMWIVTTWAGGPDPSQHQIQQQWIGDVAQTVKEQSIPKGELIKALVLDIIEDIGWTKALLWLAMLPLAGLATLVFGAVKLIKKSRA